MRLKRLCRRAALAGVLASGLLTGNVTLAQCVGGTCSIGGGGCSISSSPAGYSGCGQCCRRPVRRFFFRVFHRRCRC